MILLFISWCILLVVSIVQSVRLYRLHKRYIELYDSLDEDKKYIYCIPPDGVVDYEFDDFGMDPKFSDYESN